jgi:CRP-like cAMP-binding protein
MPDTDALLLRIASHVTLFSGMGRSALEQLLSRAEKITRKDGQLFFDEGDAGESFYVLLLGKVSVDKRSGGKWVPLSELVPGDTFGEMTLIDDRVRSARVRAVGDCVALHFNGPRIRDLHEAMAVVYRSIARLQTRRLKATNIEMADHRARLMGDEAPTGSAPHAVAASNLADDVDDYPGGTMGDDRPPPGKPQSR